MGDDMAITVEKLKGGYEFFSTMDGYYLTLPNGETKFFVFYGKLEEYCKENGIDGRLSRFSTN